METSIAVDFGYTYRPRVAVRVEHERSGATVTNQGESPPVHDDVAERAEDRADGRRPSPFRLKPFRIYWAGGLLSNSGTWLYNVTASVVMLELTGSPFMVGLLNFANFAPLFLFSFVAGVLSDRIDRRALVVTLSMISCAVSSALAIVAFNERTTAGMLIAASFVLGTSYSFAKPALSALLPGLVDERDIANSTAINTLQFTLGQVVGSSLAALLLPTVGPAPAFALNAFTYLGPVVAMVLLRPFLRPLARQERSGLDALREGLRFVTRESGLARVVVAIVFANGIVETLRTLAPVLTERGLDLSADDAGIIVGAIGAGSALGALTFGRMGRRLPPTGLARLGFGMQAAGAMITATATSLFWAAAGSIVIGVGFAYLIPRLNATMQERSPDLYRGRVMATFSMAHLGLRPIWSIIAGTLATYVGSRAALGILTAAAVGGLLVLRDRRALDVNRQELGREGTA